MQLYTEQYFQKTKKELIKRAALLLLMIAITVAGMVLFVTAVRNRIAVIAFTIVCVWIMFAYLSIKLLPWIRYWRYQADIRSGMSRASEGWFVSCSDETRVSDGVAFHELIIRVGDGEEDERLFFWDDDMQLPEIKEGQKLSIRSFGNYITELDVQE